MFNFILMNLIVGTTSLLQIKYFFHFKSLSDNLISFFILFLSQIILSLQLLGIKNILFFNNIIILNFVFLVLTVLIIKIFKITAKGGILVKLRKDLSGIKLNKTISFCLSFIIGFVLIKIFVNLINPPFGWDDLNYHYTFPVEWMKNGNLDNPIVVSDDPFPSYYPINGSLLFFWLILPFKSAFFADLGQLPFFIIAFFAIFSIGKKLKLNNEYSLLAACLFVITPNFFKQLQIGYVDMMVGAMFFVIVNFILNIKEKFDIKNVIIFAISFGILIGIKTTALPYSFFIFVLFVFLVFNQKERRFKNKFGFIFLFFLAVFVFGCFGYFRNLIITGNPFYPLEQKILGMAFLKGVIDKATFTSRNVEDGYSLVKLLFHEGLGMQSLLIVLPATIFAIPLNIFKNKNRDIFSNYIMFLPLLLYLIYRYVLPIPNSRYLYPALGVGMALGFYHLSTIRIPIKYIRIASIVILVSSLSECARHLELVVSLGAGFLFFTGYILSMKYKKLRVILFSKKMLTAYILIFVFFLQWAFLNYRENEYMRYVQNSRYWPDATRAWAWLNENTIGNNIAYVGKPVPYPLYGTGLKNNVYYVSVNSIDPIRLHDLKDSEYRWGRWKDDARHMHKNFEQPNNYRGRADYSIWLHNLKNRGVDFLFIYSLHHTKDVVFPVEEEWAKNHAEEFNLVFSNNSVRIYKLNR